MFLIAGLLGMALSGVMMIAPLSFDADAEDPAPDPVEGDPVGEGASSPLSVALEGASGPGATADAQDMLAGDHLSDRLGGSAVDPIAFDSDAIFGGSGDDAMQGGDRNDLMLGGDGDDLASGGAGRDEIQGGGGDDTLFGGGGDDVLLGEEGDDLLGGGNGADLLSGGEGADRLGGGAGDDRLFGGLGADELAGGLGDDLLDGTVMENGFDVDTGDTLSGGDGDDTLAGDAGDVLIGGAGADHYLFRAAPVTLDPAASDAYAAPRIEDFDPEADLIEIEYEAAGTPPDLSISRTAEGSELRLDGELVAFVAGPAVVEAGHVSLVALA
ncbi:calcium-binding protein [Jannaschia ovalis]|uniref:Calcium-binding protein n=1 Tax=Jannaschia ovalis TaxID=3038773 RepID=A0ABY8LHG3_9RHOB|nr:calcium-binding protein [Jannaschia sp. GRR-S6-38]WGH79800.1 calcium-binding protein [Jannaschia sp. GRR-S6-38]